MEEKVDTAREEAPVLRFSWDNITIDFPSRVLSISGIEIPLSPTEFDLFWELVARRGAVVSYAEILSKVWQNQYGTGKESIYNYIRRLRSKIEEDPHNPRYILSKSRIGYRVNMTPP